jgi:predicted transcriptional regulator
MTLLKRKKFSSRASPDVLAQLRELALAQGRQFQAVLDDAMREYLERQNKTRPRQHVMASFASSLEEFESLYSDLAK